MEDGNRATVKGFLGAISGHVFESSPWALSCMLGAVRAQIFKEGWGVAEWERILSRR